MPETLSKGMRRTALNLILLLAFLAFFAVNLANAAEPLLLVKNAILITMAPDQKKPIVGYLLVDRDGRLLLVAEVNRRAAATMQH